MGIWIELGIFIVVLLWGVWQLHDVKKAIAQTRADKTRQPVETPEDTH
jgi:cytochrome oxidase assembly protein ShyY1